MSIKPEKLADNLLSKLHDLGSTPSMATPIALKALKRDAEKLQQYDACTAFVILAGISYFEHDTNEMVRLHKKAVSQYPNDYIANVNYAVSLHNTGRYNQAFEYTQKALTIQGKHDPEVLTQACSYAYAAGLFHNALKFGEQLETMKLIFPHSEIIRLGCETINDNNLSKSDIHNYFCATSNILNGHDLYPKGEALWVSEEQELVREIFVNTSPEEASKMNAELSELVAKMELPAKMLMKFCCLFTVGDNQINKRASQKDFNEHQS